MEQENEIQAELEKQIAEMFSRMSGSGRRITEERQKALLQFTNSFAEKQGTFLKSFEENNKEVPALQKKSTKTVEDANKQFSPLVEFINAKEAEIDGCADNLLKFNNEMSSNISAFLDK